MRKQERENKERQKEADKDTVKKRGKQCDQIKIAKCL